MALEVQSRTMRSVRTIVAVLIALGLTLSPVAAGMVQVKMVKCDHEMMMVMDQDDCACCDEAAKCPPSACLLKCFNSQAVRSSDAPPLALVHERLGAVSAVTARSQTFPPEPPPPRA